jgi:hypothetical protein
VRAPPLQRQRRHLDAQRHRLRLGLPIGHRVRSPGPVPRELERLVGETGSAARMHRCEAALPRTASTEVPPGAWLLTLDVVPKGLERSEVDRPGEGPPGTWHGSDHRIDPTR